MTQQLEMFDKPISEIRALQIVDTTSGQNVAWQLEFRFYGETAWHPVKLVSYAVTENPPETSDVPEENSSESNESAAGN